MDFKELFLQEQSFLTAVELARIAEQVRSGVSGGAKVAALAIHEAPPEAHAVQLAESLDVQRRKALKWTAIPQSKKERSQVDVQSLKQGTIRRKPSTDISLLLEDVDGDYEALTCAHGETQDSEVSRFLGTRTNAATGEPFVSFVGMDRTGIALSGGGIRSATFNLGILQGLNHHGLLEHFDYLSTVSGGGYIGGWWSAWKYRIGQHRGMEFPEVSPGNPPAVEQERPPEPDEVRHLREFSNFLVPRLGFFNVDMWYGVVAILGGMVPTLIMGSSLLGITCLLWLFAHFFLGLAPSAMSDYPILYPAVGIVSMAALTAAVLILFEWWWRRSAIAIPGSDRGGRTCASFTAIAIIASGLIQGVLLFWPASRAWFGIDNSLHALVSSPALQLHLFWLVPVLAWVVPAVFLLIARYFIYWINPRGSTTAALAAGSRVVGRLLGLTLVWIALAVIWEVAHFSYSFSIRLAVGYGGATVAAAETFRRVRSWMNSQPTKAQTGSLVDAVKRVLPQVLAYFAVLMGAVLVIIGIIALWNFGWCVVMGCFAIDIVLLAILCWVLDPEALGLHAFYRERILRTYLGASNTKLVAGCAGAPTAAQNRQTEEDANDDLLLSDFTADPDRLSRPLHLVCCAANDLAGDHLANLGRGARSAVLSPFGISIGNVAMSAPDVTVSNAQTASAAAFNSQMGSVSRRLGPAVTFLLAALNLRLGLWARVADSPQLDEEIPRSRRWRGWLLLKEFWSGSICPAPLIPPQDVHLSDGGHFENLGLYELVRRHCRFIVVSDCGADPDYKFDDLGNAFRRIRSDFGVEIEIDLTPLIPQDGRPAAQHLVVGTIYYDQKSDQGLLFVFKPNLAGEEPEDIRQYRQRNTAFPQETTGDQFYDEAQWESYRRLGEHAARSAFRFLERLPDRPSRYFVFTEAFWRWSRAPEGFDTKMLEVTRRASAFLAEARDSHSEKLIRDLLPEISWLNDPEFSYGDATLAIELAQLMEDVFVALSIDQTYTIPLASGWHSFFGRAAASDSFRKWWPIVQSLFSRAFRQFLNDEYELADVSPGAQEASARRRVIAKTDLDKDEKLWQSLLFRVAKEHDDGGEKLLLVFDLDETKLLPLGFLRCQVTQIEGRNVGTWHADDLVIRRPMRGINVLTAYLPLILDNLAARQVTRVEVDVESDSTRTDAAFRAFHAERLRLYMSLGFKLRRRNGQQYLSKRIQSKEPTDTQSQNVPQAVVPQS